MLPSSELLREHGLRVTAGRIALLDVLAEQSHLTTDQIAAGVRARIGTVSMQATYHMVESLTSAGLLRRVAVAGGAVRYERRVGDNHHHLVCRGCGEVSDVDCGSTQGPCHTPPDQQGYQIDEAEIIFWGTCPRCLASHADTTTTRSHP